MLLSDQFSFGISVNGLTVIHRKFYARNRIRDFFASLFELIGNNKENNLNKENISIEKKISESYLVFLWILYKIEHTSFNTNFIKLLKGVKNSIFVNSHFSSLIVK